MAHHQPLPRAMRGTESKPVSAWASTVARYCPFLAGLPEPLLLKMGRRRQSRRFSRGDLIVRSGEPAVGILVITDGLLKASIPGYERVGPSRILQRGELCCEVALFTGMPQTTDIRAVTDGGLFVLDGRDVKEAVGQCNDFAERVIRHVCGQSRLFELQVRVDGSRAAAARLASQILILSSMQESGGARMSQDALAELIGVSRETVNRVLRQWKQAGLVDVGHGRVVPREAFWRHEVVAHHLAPRGSGAGCSPARLR